MPDDKEEKPAAPAPVPTSAEEIEKGKSKRRTTEERLSFLEDENANLRTRNETLEKSLDGLCKKLELIPSSQPGKKSLLAEIGDWLDS